MTAASWVLVAVTLAVCAGDWMAVATRTKPVEYVCKPLALALVVATAATLHPVDADRRWWFVAALVLGLCGDVLLMLDGRFFVAGLASFLVGHALYIVGLLVRGPGSHPGVVGSLVATGAVLVVAFWPALRIVRSVRRDHPPLTAPVIAYVAVICAMAAIALDSGNALAATGAVLFVVSDTTLAWNRFVRSLAGGPLAVIVTYHAAQILLATSLVR